MDEVSFFVYPFRMGHITGIVSFILSHLFPIALSVGLAVVTGFVWYGVLFAKQWSVLTGIDPASDKNQRQVMIHGTAVTVLMALIQSAVLGRLFEVFLLKNLFDALTIAALFWLPFSGLVCLNNYVWSRKPIKLLCIDAGYSLAVLWVIATVLYVLL